MLTVTVLYDNEGRAAIEPLLSLTPDPAGVRPTPALKFHEIKADMRLPPVADAGHLVVIAAAKLDPRKATARRWLAGHSPRAPKLTAAFVGKYDAPPTALDVPWQEVVHRPAAADPWGAWEGLLATFAEYAHPRVVAIDDNSARLDLTPQPFAALKSGAAWVVRVPYRVPFAGRHGGDGAAVRRALRTLARGSTESKPVRFLLDVQLGEGEGAFSGCRALALELLHADDRCRVYPISDHGQREEHFRSFAVLGDIFPGRVFKPSASWADRVFAEYVEQLDRSVTPPFAEAATALDADPPSFAVSVADGGRQEVLGLAALTWLGDDFPWVLDGAREAGGDALRVVFQPGPAAADPDGGRYREFLPERLPTDFLTDWHPRRLAAPVEEWESRTATRPVLANRVLYTGPREKLVTAACYIDGDNVLYHYKNDMKRLAEMIFRQWLKSRADAMPAGRTLKFWMCVACNLGNARSPVFADMLDHIGKEAAAANLFKQSDPDIDFIQLHIVPDKPQEAADMAITRLWASDGPVDYKLLVTMDLKLAKGLLFDSQRTGQFTVLNKIKPSPTGNKKNAARPSEYPKFRTCFFQTHDGQPGDDLSLRPDDPRPL